ncbi:unnamed protein product [Cyprideis torosa]|uniref:Peptidoglycan-recognition protein n=1 Tax=Cyprideis torosa TaxID=163714 RepID=A0A7R8W8U7_9CRUS|nr:unnamed protein product [Cyprideis torosa]CAG0889007.1 unnamed protein product [Cyprideis torosa]
MAGTPAWAIVHHTESPSCSTQSECSSLVRSFQDYHMDVNGWADIGYSFLIGGDGNVYEGRGWDRVGAHTPGYNSNGLGISMIGSFMTSLPNQQALDALNNLIACGVDSGELQQNYGLIGHRQAVATSCPGDRLYEYVQAMPHWQDI